MSSWRAIWWAVLGAAIAVVSLLAALAAVDRAVTSGRERLLLAETDAAARLLGEPAGDEKLGRLLPGRWARSGVVRPGLDRARVSTEPEGLVGHAPIPTSAPGTLGGTVAVLERRENPRGIPPSLTWTTIAMAALIVAISAVSALRTSGRWRMLTSIVTLLAIVVSAAMALHWAGSSLRQFERHHDALRRSLDRIESAGGASTAPLHSTPTSPPGQPSAPTLTLIALGAAGFAGWLLAINFAARPGRTRNAL
jgi:hypothetical protein